MDSADLVRVDLLNQGQHLRLQEEEPGLLRQELKETVHKNESMNFILWRFSVALKIYSIQIRLFGDVTHLYLMLLIDCHFFLAGDISCSTPCQTD